MATLKNEDFIIIDTRTTSAPKGRQFEYAVLEDHPEYAQLRKMQMDDTLVEKFPRSDTRISHDASNFHTPRMMKETESRYKTDEDGLLFIEKENEELAKEILMVLQRLDKDIHLSKYGRQFSVIKPKK